MTLQVNLVNLGTYPNDGSGDDLRSAFVKSNGNFQSISENVVLSASNLGTGAPLFLDKSANTLRFRSINSSNSNMSISYDSQGISLSVQDSINRLQEDTDPILGGNLVLNGFDIEGFGNITITGDITADTITGNFEGDFSGNISGDVVGTLTGTVYGDLQGNVYGFDTTVQIMAVDIASGDYNNIFLNSLVVTGNSSISSGITTLATLLDDGLNIFSDLDLTLGSNGNVVVDTDLVVNGTVIGQISDISNHNLQDLGDVSSTSPTNGQALLWNGTTWTPGNVATSGGVTKIIAGTNVSISPTIGTGEVTINSTGGTTSFNNYDFGLLSGVRDAFDLIVQFTNVDFGSITAASQINLNLGSISEVALYNLSASVSSVLEGDIFYVNLTTANVPNGTSVPYQITGVSPGDIGAVSLTGNFVVNNGFATVMFTAMPDAFVENETFTLTLTGIVPTVSVSVDILDSSAEWTSGDIDGGGPGTTSFTLIADGGGPSTSSFTAIANGGIVIPIIDGGAPGTTIFSDTLEGGNPSSSPTEVYDGGIVT